MIVVRLPACSGSNAQPPKPQVVLYSSIDDPILRPILGEFTKDTGIEVLVVGDTEATKTTGLVERLLSEKERPRADVWWSSEPLGTIRLAREGVLEKVELDWKARERPGGWERDSAQGGGRAGGAIDDVRSADGLWWMVGLRRRAIVTRIADAAATSASLKDLFSFDAHAELMNARIAGRIGMARPQFGSTRTQLAWIGATWTREDLTNWLTRLRSSKVRLYDGNSSVTRALAQGEIDIGFTDSDDVAEGIREGWDLRMITTYEWAPRRTLDESRDRYDGIVAAVRLELPTTVARVKAGPNPQSAARLIDWLISHRVEQLLHEQNAGWGSLSEVPREDGESGASLRTLARRLVEAEAASAEALKLWDEVIGR